MPCAQYRSSWLPCLFVRPPGMGETLPSRPTTFLDHVAVLNLVLDFLEDKPKLLLSFRGGFLTVDRMLLETPERASIHCTSGPIVEGEKLLHELLRQKSIASRLSGIDPITTDELKAQLASGKDIRIAGNPLTAAFAQQISAQSIYCSNFLAKAVFRIFPYRLKRGKKVFQMG